MSRGKYSPWCYGNNQSNTEYTFNCYGEVPVEWNKENYDEKLMFDGYDSEGFDSYGYSAFEVDGAYSGIGNGVDRYGYTENEYLSMTDEQFQHVSAYADLLHNFKRNRDTEVKPKMNKRKTKAEKETELQAAKKAQNDIDWEEFTKNYPNRFAALIFDYFRFGQTDYNLNVVKNEDSYEFCSGSGWNRVGFVLTAIPPKEYNWEYMQSILDAERPIEEERERIKEAMRKQQLRETALSKLTDEEKKALGFTS